MSALHFPSCSLLLIWVLSWFLFLYIYKKTHIYSQASNPSCEACQEAAAIRRTAEIVFLTVTGSVRQNCFPERSTRRTAIVVRISETGSYIHASLQVLHAMKSSPGCPYWSPTFFSLQIKVIARFCIIFTVFLYISWLHVYNYLHPSVLFYNILCMFVYLSIYLPTIYVFLSTIYPIQHTKVFLIWWFNTTVGTKIFPNTCFGLNHRCWNIFWQPLNQACQSVASMSSFRSPQLRSHHNPLSKPFTFHLAAQGARKRHIRVYWCPCKYQTSWTDFLMECVFRAVWRVNTVPAKWVLIPSSGTTY